MNARRRWLIVAALAVAVVTFLGTAVGIQQRFEKAQDWVFSDKAAPVLAARFHQGRAPCRRYVVASSIPEDNLQFVARMIIDRGWLPRMNDLIAVSLTMSEEEERRHHDLHRGEELRDMVLDRLSATDAFWFRVIGRGHLEAIVEAGAERDVELAERYKRVIATWPVEERKGLRRTWRERPTVFSSAGMPALIDAVKRELDLVRTTTTSK